MTRRVSEQRAYPIQEIRGRTNPRPEYVVTVEIERHVTVRARSIDHARKQALEKVGHPHARVTAIEPVL